VQRGLSHDTIVEVNMKPDTDKEQKLPTPAQAAITWAPSGSLEESLDYSSPLLISGSRVGDYVIEEAISSGGFGTVYRAVHALLGVRAAVKVLHADLISNVTNVRRFEREVDVIRRLRHPNVVDVFDFGQLEDGRPFFIMELLSGEALDEYLERRGRLQLEETLAILEPLASALDMAHAQSIVHRDIKASNVFVCDEGGVQRVVLLDFGIAKLLDSDDPALTASRQIIGTVSCMAPEQFLGLPVDERADVYALGFLAYAMLTGKVPYDVGHSGAASSISLFYSRPPPPSQHAHVNAAVDAPILRALAPDSCDRPSSAGEFVAELKAAIEKARLAEGSSDKAIERQGIAVHVELRLDPSILEEPDEDLLRDIESILPLVACELCEAGLLPAMETGNNLLAVAECPDEREVWSSLRKRIVETVMQTKEQLERRPHRDARIAVTFIVTTGMLLVNEGGALIGGGLLDPASWLPAFSSDGVLLSNAVAEGLNVHAHRMAHLPGFLLLNNL
jgi:eukaryotic-like serine/threonine-protein kinase